VSNARCRFCGSELEHSFADLGMSPVSNAFRRPEQAEEAELFFPLHAFVCAGCKLVQVRDHRAPDDMFREDYAYFSSFSDSWLRHAEAYAAMATERFGLGPRSRVVEIASNDGYLLRFFKARGIPVLGVEPSANVAEAARRDHGIESWVRFFGAETARELVAAGWRADLMAANNVLAHVPDINDFVEGFRIALAPGGVATFEFPHLVNLIRFNQFDTIYHEHYSYLSLLAAERIMAAHGLSVFDAERLPTHGGSLRLYVAHAEAGREASARLDEIRAEEAREGLHDLAVYAGFAEKVRATKRALLRFLIDAKEAGARVVAYGAPAKGNTLLNYCGVGRDMIDFTVDRSHHKQGLLLPGTGIPVLAPEAIDEARPDYVLILPWNLQEEIVDQMARVRGWGGRFVVPIPEVRVLP
jgi:SAM-dependent methyltransferase